MNNNDRKFIWIGVFILFLGAIFVISRLKPQTSKFFSQTPSSSPLLQKPSLKFVPSQVSTIYKAGEPMHLDVVVNSLQKPITGFDIVLHFNPKVVHFEGIGATDQSFEMHTTKDTAKLIITGSKKISQVPNSLQDDRVMTISFSTIAQGAADFTVEYTEGSKADSNLIDTESHDILGQVNSPHLYVGKEVELPKGTRIAIDSHLSAVVEKVSSAKSQCADCISSASVSYFDNSDKPILIYYQDGGLAGNTNTSDKIGSYMIELEKIQANSVVIRIYATK